MKQRSGVRTAISDVASERGTRKGLEGLGGFVEWSGEHSEERAVFYRGMEQKHGSDSVPPESPTPDGQLMLPNRWSYRDGGGCAQIITQNNLK